MFTISVQGHCVKTGRSLAPGGILPGTMAAHSSDRAFPYVLDIFPFSDAGSPSGGEIRAMGGHVFSEPFLSSLCLSVCTTVQPSLLLSYLSRG